MRSVCLFIFCSWLGLEYLVDSYSLVCSIPALSITTHYLGIQDHANTVIDLIFLSMSL